MNESESKSAQVEALPPEYADKILSASSIRRIRTLYGIVFPLTIIAAVGLLVWAANLRNKSIDDANPSDARPSIALCISGISLIAALLIVRLLVGTRNQWLRRVARKEVNRRPDKIVNPDAPDARFVELVPKSAWHDKTLVENASDVGFLQIENGCLLYEGDNERYRIPASAIVKCEQDNYTRLVESPTGHGASMQNIFLYFVVVTVKVSEGMTVELPFRIRRSPKIEDQKASDANYQLLRDINHLKATARTGSIAG